jgi:hypothetical protein
MFFFYLKKKSCIYSVQFFTVWRKTFVKLAGFVNNDLQEKNSCAKINIFVKTIYLNVLFYGHCGLFLPERLKV